MLWVIGINHKVDIDIRQKFSLTKTKLQEKLIDLKKLANEVIILNTCNRVEIYFFSEDYIDIEKIFTELGWDKKYMHLFYIHKDKDCIKHLFEVVCGFDSLIIGEEQIVAQVKEAKEISKLVGGKNPVLERLFEVALKCSKEFRTKSKLNEHPITIASVVGRVIKESNIKKVAIIGLGNIGFLFCNYFKNSDVDKVFLIGRKNEKIDQFVKLNPEKFGYYDKKEAILEAQCLICSTSAPHPVVHKDDIPEGKSLLIFDLAVPRDVDVEVYKLPNVKVIDIDQVHKMDTVNKEFRISKMQENYHIIDKYVDEFIDWLEFRQYKNLIMDMKKHAEQLCKMQVKKLKDFDNQEREKIEVLLLRIANLYIDRAVEVLREAHKEGSGEICSNLMRRIFLK
ncbi:glutamyl-tRNA reductase [Caldicellulosiruptor acetigenus I77R1B]|uniref:Glutamyl-tRNA reductase n=1 Tax=Caldicellulosiruptor acetigenus (strain ATCC 700853 / DSM 12137 / I77R1B) TaxID=632335 RepID=E4S6S1_CALA7|nr:glutamyl-tRNA reductase [Caldicellulosiruptor acetigenus]ADQ40686.1 glutamyl-tRNA reductase [Caldicellulosiruptor acetigenus I77R1B]